MRWVFQTMWKVLDVEFSENSKWQSNSSSVLCRCYKSTGTVTQKNEGMCARKDMYKNVHNNLIHSPKPETTQMSINQEWINKLWLLL